MASRSRCVTCPKCRQVVRVRDTFHLRQHGVRLQGWRCCHCSKEVPSDRSHDLRDHVKRRHPKEDAEWIRPIWFYFRSEQDTSSVSSGNTQSARVPSSRRRSTPVPRDFSKPVEKEEVITIHVGDISFMTDDSESPKRLPKSVVQQKPMLTPVRSPVRPPNPPSPRKNSGRGTKRSRPSTSLGGPTKSTPSTSTTTTTTTTSTTSAPASSGAVSPPPVQAAAVVQYTAGLDAGEWEQLHASIMAARGITARDASTQVHLLSRAGASTRPPTPTTVSVSTQTVLPTTVLTRAGEGVHLSFPDGSSVSVRGPVWEPREDE